MKYTWLTIGALAASAAAVCGILLLRRKKAAGQTKQDTDTAQELTPVIADGIRENAEIFNGLYEGLFQAVRNQDLFSTDAYEEWCDRASQLDSEAFRSAFVRTFSKGDMEDEALCRAKMERLLSCIERAGICRERENGVSYPADAAMRRAYLTIDESSMETGAEYTVVKSAWVCRDRVIEYGMAVPTAAKETQRRCLK